MRDRSNAAESASWSAGRGTGEALWSACPLPAASLHVCPGTAPTEPEACRTVCATAGGGTGSSPAAAPETCVCASPPCLCAGGERLLPPLPGPPHQPTYASVGPQREYACGLYLPLRRLRGGEQAATAAATPADACLAGLPLPAGPGGPIKRSMRPASLRRCMASRTLMSSMECENTKYLPTKHC